MSYIGYVLSFAKRFLGGCWVRERCMFEVIWFAGYHVALLGHRILNSGGLAWAQLACAA